MRSNLLRRRTMISFHSSWDLTSTERWIVSSYHNSWEFKGPMEKILQISLNQVSEIGCHLTVRHFSSTRGTHLQPTRISPEFPAQSKLSTHPKNNRTVLQFRPGGCQRMAQLIQSRRPRRRRHYKD
jgi:hypothetical protein